MSDKLFGVLTSGTLEERDRQQLELFSAHTARQLPALADLVKQGLLACGRQPVERDTVLNWLGRLVSDLLSVEEVAAFMRELQVDTRESLEIIHRVHFELDRGAKSLGRATNAFRAALGRLMLLQASGFLYCDAGETTGGRSSERSSTLSVASPEGETIKAHEFVHEVRNFLNGVRLHSLLLSRFVTADEHLSEASEAVRAVDASIERISELLEGQHFGASSTGRARVSLRSLCARVVQNVSTRAEAAGVPFGAELELTEDLTGRDLDKLELVLLDLVQTAVENALESEGRVVLRARREREYAVI